MILYIDLPINSTRIAYVDNFLLRENCSFIELINQFVCTDVYLCVI